MKWILKETGEDVQGGFEIIEADPCWKYGVQGGRGGADKHYETMELHELVMLPVEKLAAENAILLLWATWPLMPHAFALMKAWGFKFKNCGFIWAKTNKISPTPFVGLGHWTRGNSEVCFLGVRGKPTRIDAAVQQLIIDDLVVTPIGEHSEKPDEVKNRIIRLVGDVPAIELFARRRTPGFECWGNEGDPTVELQP